MVKLHFLSNYSEQRSVKYHELQKSEIRSHAAAVSHGRRQQTSKRRAAGGSQSVNQHQPEKENEDNDPKTGVQKLVRGDFPVFRGTRTDPFNCISTDHPRLLDASLDFYIHSTMEAHSSIYDIFDTTNPYTSYTFEMMQNSDFAYCIMTLLLALMERSRGRNAETSPDVLRTLQICLSRIRKRLSNPSTMSDDISMWGVIFLAVVARLMNDSNSHKLHRTTFKQMTEARGGVGSLASGGRILSEVLQSTVLQWESLWSLESGSLDFYPDVHQQYVAVFPELPLSGRALEMTNKLPAGFQVLANIGKISLQTLTVLVRTEEAHRTNEGSWSTQPPGVLRYQKNRYYDFIQACPCLGDIDPAIENIEKLLVLAVMLYCANNVVRTRRRPSMLLNEVRRKLSRDVPMAKFKSSTEMQCMIWISVVLVDTWVTDDGTLLAPGQPMLEVMRTKFTRNLSWDQLENILYKFFWTKQASLRFRRCYNLPRKEH